jgi:S1-C subfamily serine protease
MSTLFRIASNRARKALLFTCLPITLSVSPTALAENGEDIFEKAPLYTVQIRTTVNMPFTEDIRSSSMGAGFVVDADRGWVMTNAHVAARSPSKVRVRFQGGDYHEATKVYVDSYLDLAILELDESQREALEVAKLDCDGFPPIGHPVGAFGHPWNLVYTGTRGIISGVTSRMGTELLQTDAPINGGNSGGPLISLQSGKIVGLSTSSINKDDDQNTNFAVPMKYACRVLRLLQEGKDPSPPQLLAMFYEDLDDEGKLTVAQTYLADDTLALQIGDTITGVSGVTSEIRNEGQLVNALRGRLENVKLEITRSGSPVIVEGRLEPASRVIEQNGVFAAGILFGRMGWRDSRELNLALPIMVHSVEYGTLGESLEIEEWDMLVSVDGKPVEDLNNLYDRLEAADRARESVHFVFKRWSNERDRVYDYIERTMAIEDLEFVGPPPLGHLASRN